MSCVGDVGQFFLCQIQTKTPKIANIRLSHSSLLKTCLISWILSSILDLIQQKHSRGKEHNIQKVCLSVLHQQESVCKKTKLGRNLSWRHCILGRFFGRCSSFNPLSAVYITSQAASEGWSKEIRYIFQDYNQTSFLKKLKKHVNFIWCFITMATCLKHPFSPVCQWTLASD